MNIIRIKSNEKFKRLLTLFDKLSPFLISLIFTIFYFLFVGYKFAVSDEGGWLVYLNKRLDPSLYVNDYLWSSAQSLPQEKFSIFSDLDFFASSFLSLNFPLTHFILLFLTKFLLFLFIYLGALTIFKNKSAAILSVIAFIPGYFFLGPLVGSNENNFIPRVLSQPLILGAIILAFSQKLIPAWFLIGISLSIHPVSALPIMLLIAILTALTIRDFGLRKILMVVFAFFIGVLPLMAKLLAGSQDQSLVEAGPISEYLREVVIERKGYIFLSNWNNNQWIDTTAVFFLGLPFFLFFKKNFSKLKPKIFIFWLSIIFSNFIYFFATELGRFGLFLPLQFPRSIVYVYLINLILFAGIIIYFFGKRLYLSSILGIIILISIFLKEKEVFYFLLFLLLLLPFLEKPWIKINFIPNLAKPLIIFLIGAIFFTTYTLYTITTQYSYEKIYGKKKPKLLWREFIYDQIHFTTPSGDISTQLQLWIKNHTEKDAMILVDPDLGFFRNYSQRAVVFDHKDLGYVYYSDEAAKKIQERETNVADFENMTKEKLVELKKKYNFSYLVWKKSRGSLEFPIVYDQFGFLVYKLNAK